MDPKFQSRRPVPVTPFQHRVYALCRQIPPGSVATYKSIADALQTFPRAVGQALRRNPFAPEVPCHRVVAVRGLGGFFGHTDPEDPVLSRKRALLQQEGVTFQPDGTTIHPRHFFYAFRVSPGTDRDQDDATTGICRLK